MVLKNLKKEHKIAFAAAAVIIAIAAFVLLQYAGGQNQDNVAAEVNGVKIMKDNVVLEYLKVPVEYRKYVTSSQVLDGMITKEVLLQEAARKGVLVTEEDVDSYISESLADAGKTQQDFLNELESAGFTLEEAESQIRNDLVISRLIELEVISEIIVSDEEVQRYYDDNPDEFVKPEEVKVSHILVNSSKDASSIRNKALAGLDFAELAVQYSTCPSSAKGGDLGWFTRGKMVKEFEDAAFALQNKGDISPVVETQFGFHILKLTGRTEARLKDFSDVSRSIKSSLLQEKQADAIEAYTSQLESRADIKIYMYELPDTEPIKATVKMS